MKERKILGVIGGMGPLTTASFFTRLVECTRADNDADHIHVIMDSDATIPDRTAAILQGDNGCIAAIRASAKRLVAATGWYMPVALPAITLPKLEGMRCTPCAWKRVVYAPAATGSADWAGSGCTSGC